MKTKEFKIKLIDDNNNEYSDLLYYPIGPNNKGHGFGSQLDMVYSKIYRKDCLNYIVIITDNSNKLIYKSGFKPHLMARDYIVKICEYFQNYVIK